MKSKFRNLKNFTKEVFKNHFRPILVFTGLNLALFFYNAFYEDIRLKKYTFLFALLFIILELALVIFYFYLKEKKKFKLEKIFLALALPLGFLHCFITPINQVPDEIGHLFRAYDISDGNAIAKKNDEGHYRTKITSTSYKIINNAQPDRSYYKKIATKLFEPASEEEWGWNFDNTAGYRPIAYAPQALGVKTGKILHVPAVLTMYLGRLFAILAYILIIYFAIRLTPKFKEFFIVFAMLPMAMQQGASYSVDGMAIASAFLFLALAFKYIYNSDKKLNRKQLAGLYGALFFASATKRLAYLPLGLLLVLIPSNKFNKKWHKFLHLALMLIICVAADRLWTMMQDHTTITAIAEAASTSVAETTSAAVASSNPLKFLIAAFGTFFGINTEGMLNTTFGTRISYTYLAPLSIYPLIFLALIAVMILRTNEKIVMKKFHKIILWAVPIITAVAFYYIAYHDWGYVKSDELEIVGIQGRYFIPLLPLIPFLFYHDKKDARPLNIDYIFYFTIFANICLLATKFLHNI